MHRLWAANCQLAFLRTKSLLRALSEFFSVDRVPALDELVDLLP